MQTGDKAVLRTPDFGVAVVIENVRHEYGRVRYLVRPLQGEGMKWVDEERLRAYGGENVATP